LAEQGYKIRWSTANKENERIEFEGWERVLVDKPDGTKACLKIHNHRGYMILLKKKME
jgi:hypothetical protein